MVTVSNNKPGKHLLNFRQDKELSKLVLFVDFQNVYMCMEMKGENFSLILIDTHFQFSCWKERSYYLLLHPEDTEAERLSKLPTITQLVSGRVCVWSLHFLCM